MNGRDLALGLVAGLALAGAVRKRGSRATLEGIPASIRRDDLPPDMVTLLGDFIEERYGSDDGEPPDLPTRIPLRLVPVDPLYRQVKHDAWDDRGPAHVAAFVDEMNRLIPSGDRKNPDAVARHLLQPVPYTEFVRGVRRPRPNPGPAIPPIVTWDGHFADGRHRLFAAHQLGITHLPAIEMADLEKDALAGSAARTTPVKTVPVERFWTIPSKLEETLTDIAEGRRSYSYDAPLRVSALDTPRGHYFVLDGHHRLVERLQAGDRTVEVELDAHLPRIERTGGGYRDMVAQKVNIAARVRRGSASQAAWPRVEEDAKRGGANTDDREIFVTTTTGDEVFGHVTTRAGAEAIQRQGFRVGEGKYGTGVYLLSPEEEWGGGLPPAATHAHAFQLRWHEGRDDLRVLRVALPAGTRLLRVVSSPGDATLQAMKVLHGDAAGTERYRAAWKRDREEATLHEDLRAARIDGVYWVDPVWNADEILVLDPSRLTVVREQVQKGSRTRTLTNAQVGGRVRDTDYDGTPWLYHWTTHAGLLRILQHGLRPGEGSALGRGARSHSKGRVFFSSDPEKWYDPPRTEVLLRVPTRAVDAVYDGGTAMDDDAKLSDAYVTRSVPPDLIEIVKRGSTARTPAPTAHRTDPALWERVKAEVTASDKGGRPGQWSARKAQRAVQLYKERGGGYLGPKDPDNALARWTRQDWRTYSGAESLETGERYLPAEAFDLLTPAEIGATTRAKREGMRKGRQFVPQPPKIAAKVKPTRQGNANTVHASGYDKTAIRRTGPSAPVQHVHSVASDLLRGRVLDFGSGRGADAKALRATAYDPHHPRAEVRRRPTGTFDTVLMTYVLNVLPKGERETALREAASHVRKGGTLLLSVRPAAEVAETVQGDGWVRSGDGHFQRDADGGRSRFQRGYTAGQLAAEVKRVLGSSFRPVELPALSGSVVGAWRRA